MKWFLFLILFSVASQSLYAQTAPLQGDVSELYYRILQLNGKSVNPASWMIRPFTVEQDSVAAHPWGEYQNQPRKPLLQAGEWFQLYLFEPYWFQSYNTNRPRGTNDGAIWQGRGYNSALSAGFRIEAGPLHMQFRPITGYSANRDFDLGPYRPFSQNQPYSSRLRRIDDVVRFGPESFSWFDMGDTNTELRFKGLKTGISNERIWSGPALHNPLLYSYHAPGFWHVHFGSYRPLHTPMGSIEFKYLFGATQKSDYFDNHNRLQSVTSLMVAWSPRFIEGLSVGFNRSYLDRYPKNATERRQLMSKVFDNFLKINLGTDENPFADDPDNQLLSLFARWEVPAHGFEIYSEFGRNDANYEWLDSRTIPHHHRAWMIGALKAFELSSNRILSVNLELTQLEEPRSSMVLGSGGGLWYFHSKQILGFTNRGQVMGSGIGPGGNSQVLAAALFTEQGFWGLTFSRTVYRNGALMGNLFQVKRANELPAEELQYWMLHHMDFTVGFRITRFIGNSYEVSAGLEQTLILNEHFLLENDLMNTRLELSLRIRMPGWIR